MAEAESWRKELYRPATYVHKWWARRLGTVFREVMLAAADEHDNVEAKNALSNKIVFDPFAGSGTTLVEALKLGARVVGRDINPVATLTQRQAIAQWDWEKIERLHQQVQTQVAEAIDSYYRAKDGRPVLFYFWVSVATCPECESDVELFSNYVFARHAYLRIRATGQATCPRCHAVCPVDLTADKTARCEGCERDFDLAGPVKNRHMTCPQGHTAAVLDALNGATPTRRMFAKLVLNEDRTRTYLPIDEWDLARYDAAAKDLANSMDGLVLPEGDLDDGVNTTQALRWGYSTWKSFYNERQLLCLGYLAQSLKVLPVSHEREALVASFSKTLENNNLFCSYKGEGTGPVRSVFHNHVLRPERVSVEGNPWGAAGGSGGFAEALSRLRRAHEYKLAPSDLTLDQGKVSRTRGRSQPLEREIVEDWASFKASETAAYVTTGDAADTDLPNRSIDLIITDPPYVDNVHYAELADFFHVWMRSMAPFSGYTDRDSTRNDSEVQNASSDQFKEMISDVFKECHRVLKPRGQLVFSFHQSTATGWSALMQALREARFEVTATRPVVAEVTTSLSKIGALEPNRIDVIVIARKRKQYSQRAAQHKKLANHAMLAIRQLRDGGIKVGAGDARSAVRAAVLAQGTRLRTSNWEHLEHAANQAAAQAAQSLQQ
ncbi:DNA methyltransferase [Kineosporia babensis]|uniref:DNA methylase N-4/N-6 domain-containing protein n=1 Tax=Kineosporia babensis TaxID=499548 RepID=A0A9X1N8R0_9ACTN|nr:hypothetical protein [Kineosporia babensis]